MKKVLVIGSNSFSGSHFIDLLLGIESYEVIGISRSKEKSSVFLPYKRHLKPNFVFFQLDLNNDMDSIFSLLSRSKPDYIVNFAAQSEVAPSLDYPEDWYQTNTVALARLTNYLKDKKYLKRYVHISTPEIYGDCSGAKGEDIPFNPSTPYAASKLAADYFLKTLVKNYNFPLVTIRSANVYGAGQQLFKIIPRTVIYNKLIKTIEIHGGGEAIRSYIHIRDVSKGELIAMERGKTGEVYHLFPKQGKKVKDVVRMICEYMDVDFKKRTKIVPGRIGQDKAYIIDCSRTRKALGWKPTITLDAGINQVIDWITINWGEIKHMPLEYIHKP